MITIALEIVGYWLGLGALVWIVMYLALMFANACEFAVNHFFK
jgi:hypothetical protein